MGIGDNSGEEQCLSFQSVFNIMHSWFFFFFGAGDQTQGLALARQALFHDFFFYGKTDTLMKTEGFSGNHQGIAAVSHVERLSISVLESPSFPLSA
jgi:hypothetical protein